MNSRLATSALGLLASFVLTNSSCSPAPDVTGTGGSAPNTGGSSSTTGGSGVSTGGTGMSTGGTGMTTGGTGMTTGGTGMTTGGTGMTTGGTGMTTGGTASGGGPSSGGSGGAVGGTANTGGTAGAKATGGQATTTGGTANTGGTAGAKATGGAGGSATGGSSGEVTVATIFPDGPDGSLDGMLSLAPCKEKNTAGTDCTPMAYYKGKASDCAGGALDIKKTFNVGGTAGAMYKATLHFYGIAEPKIYGTGVTREASGRPGNSADGKGATPTPWASAAGGYTYPASDYNTYEVHVQDNAGKEVAVYFLNADTEQGHWVYVLNYEKTISVVGGGKVLYRTYDRNCRQIKNCGVNAANNACATESAKRVIDVSKAVPLPTNVAAAQGGLLQPQLATESDAGNAGQWLLIDVTAVAAM